MSKVSHPGGNGRLPVHVLDLVRFLAALLVVAYHLAFKAWALEGSSLNKVLGVLETSPPGYRLTWCGWIGVQVFFVVSGAVIAYSTRGVSARDFARRRLARLIPVVLITVALAIPSAVLVFGERLPAVLLLALRTICFMPSGPWLMGQFWTLPIELAFYALVCVLLASNVSMRAMRGLPWLLGLTGATYWLGAASGAFTPGGRGSELLLLQHGVFFALGMLCARLGECRLGLRHAGLAIICILGAGLQIRTTAVWEMALRADLALYWWEAYLIWLAFAVAIAVGFLWRKRIASRVERASGALRLAGLSTYPLYLSHIHIGGGILSATAWLGVGPAVLCAMTGSVVVAVVIAWKGEPQLHTTIDAALRRIDRQLDRFARPTA